MFFRHWQKPLYAINFLKEINSYLYEAPVKHWKWEFIDPDATDVDEVAIEERVQTAAELDIRSLKPIIMDAQGTPAEVDRIEAIYDSVCDEIESDDWQARKDNALMLTSSPEFWNTENRFNVLADIEYMDRLERALDTAESLFNKT